MHRSLGHRSLSSRKFQPECTAFANRAFYTDETAHRLHQSLRKCEPQTRSLHIRLLRAKTFKRHKETIQFLLRKAGSGIGNKDAHLRLAGEMRDGDVARSRRV